YRESLPGSLSLWEMESATKEVFGKLQALLPQADLTIWLPLSTVTDSKHVVAAMIYRMGSIRQQAGTASAGKLTRLTGMIMTDLLSRLDDHLHPGGLELYSAKR